LPRQSFSPLQLIAQSSKSDEESRKGDKEAPRPRNQKVRNFGPDEAKDTLIEWPLPKLANQ
jgi:hypothetical protein